MKGILAFAVALLLLPLPMIAQNVGIPRPRLKVVGLMGSGIAVSQEDPMEFMLVKAGIGTVIVSLLEEEKELTVGVLFLDGTKYKLKDVEIGNETISANLYTNETKIGSFEVSRIEKKGTVVWAGVLTVNEKSYNVYVIGAKRLFKPYEIKERVAAYCRDHPRDPNCRSKIADYCKDHPNDRRCKAITRSYCAHHLRDERCREIIKEWCKENPKAPACRILKFQFKTLKQFCEKRPNSFLCKRISRATLRTTTATSGGGK